MNASKNVSTNAIDSNKTIKKGFHKKGPYKNNLISKFIYDFKKNRPLLLMILPTVVFFIIFSYVPMAGVIIAFKKIDFALGIFRSPWAGFENFKYLFISGQAFSVTRNTVLYNVAFILTGTLLQITVAIFLSELGSKYFRKTTQAMMFLPHIISWVVVGSIAYNFFHYEFGSVNTFLKSMGMKPIDFAQNTTIWPYILVAFHLWKSVGYGSIMYLASIMSIDQEMYEAADIDGANVFQKIFHITLPCLKPTITILTLLAVGNIFRGDFGLFYQLIGNNGVLFEKTDVIDTFVYRMLMNSNEMGMAAAVGLFQSILCFVTLILVNRVVQKVDKDNALF